MPEHEPDPREWGQFPRDPVAFTEMVIGMDRVPPVVSQLAPMFAEAMSNASPEEIRARELQSEYVAWRREKGLSPISGSVQIGGDFYRAEEAFIEAVNMGRIPSMVEAPQV